jgi:DNA-binding transcriptional LysR family regulator
LVRNELEVGVVGGCFVEAGLEFAPLNTDNITLVVGSNHPWAQRKIIPLEELQTETFIFREPGSGTGTTVFQALLAVGINPQNLRIIANVGSNEAVKYAVSDGLGVSFVSMLSVVKEVERQELALVNVQGLNITRRFFLVSRTGRELSPAAGIFSSVMLEIFGEQWAKG